MENTIKAEELRLGNYVDVPRKDQSPFRIDAFESLSKTFIKVAMIHPIHGENFHPLTWYGDDLKPIPLTEEWCIKFGFQKDLENTIYKNINKHCFLCYDNNIVLLLEEENNWCIRKIKYVHELQNLYFALTGEELIFKTELDEKR